MTKFPPLFLCLKVEIHNVTFRLSSLRTCARAILWTANVNSININLNNGWACLELLCCTIVMLLIRHFLIF